MEKRLGAPSDLPDPLRKCGGRSMERGYTHEYRSTNAEDVF